MNQKLLDAKVIMNRAKTEHFISFMKKMKIALTVESGEFLISHNGGEYENIVKNPKQIGFVIEEE